MKGFRAFFSIIRDLMVFGLDIQSPQDLGSPLIVYVFTHTTICDSPRFAHK